MAQDQNMFGATSTAAEVIAGVSLAGKRAIVTGASSGIGLETARAPLVEGISGEYFEDCVIAGPHRPGVRRGVAAHALDQAKAARLWQVSLEMIAKAHPNHPASGSALGVTWGDTATKASALTLFPVNQLTTRLLSSSS